MIQGYFRHIPQLRDIGLSECAPDDGTLRSGRCELLHTERVVVLSW